VRQLRPFFVNLKKRLVKAPKVYIRDSGLLHSLLGITSLDELQGHPMIGHSWEGFAIEQIIGLLPPRWEAYFYRSAAGAEIDLVLCCSGKKPIAVEIKFSATPDLTRGFRVAFQDLQCRQGYVVYPGRDAYPLAENVTALPLPQIQRIFSENSF
jgi:predicted AAA+ superfamily ATPase